MSATLPGNPSRAFIAANPHIYGTTKAADMAEKRAETAIPGALVEKQGQGSGTTIKTPRKRRRAMNRTEQRMANKLELHVMAGDIMQFEFEGMSLRWGGTSDAPPMVYTPDFVCIMPNGKLRFIEVKGAHVWDRDVVRFKGCRAAWPFEFEMWQWKRNAWRQLH